MILSDCLMLSMLFICGVILGIFIGYDRGIEHYRVEKELRFYPAEPMIPLAPKTMDQFTSSPGNFNMEYR